MTTTYDPKHPQYTDEADVRGELTRVFDICHGCRRCVDLCPAFPTLFDLVDAVAGDAGDLTPADQDAVVDGCFQCTRCVRECPYRPDLHEWDVDVPRLMLRAKAMQRARGSSAAGSRRRTIDPARAGKLGTRWPSLANRIASAPSGSLTRRVASRVSGVSAVRVLPPFARQRFSTWFQRRGTADVDDSIVAPQGEVSVVAACAVEYHEPAIGRAVVGVLERNGVSCTLSEAGCCGAAALHDGDIGAFARIAERNVRALSAEVRAGREIVVPQPTCALVIRHEYPVHVKGPATADAQLVAGHTVDPCEYVLGLDRAPDTVLDTAFAGDVPDTIGCHVACHERARAPVPGSDPVSVELLRLTGARVEMVEQCAGIDGMWGLRAGNEERSIPFAERLAAHWAPSPPSVIVSQCHLAATAITERAGIPVLHPMQVLARAYGVVDDA